MTTIDGRQVVMFYMVFTWLCHLWKYKHLFVPVHRNR